MITPYLNQSIVWKSKGAIDEYCKPTYTSTTIKARYQYKRNMIKDQFGKEVISEAQCYTKSAIKPDDIITFDSRDWIVLSVSNIVALDGSISHYEVMV